MIIILTN